MLRNTISARYENRFTNNGLQVLASQHPEVYEEIQDILEDFSIDKSEILKGGGNETALVRRLQATFAEAGWEIEQRLSLPPQEVGSVGRPEPFFEPNVESHAIDCWKGRVFLELQWNSKDAVYCRDLCVARAAFEAGKIDVAVIITRSSSLQQPLRAWLLEADLAIDKFGCSTTHLQKLDNYLKLGYNGPCPIVVFGITENLIADDISAEHRVSDAVFFW